METPVSLLERLRQPAQEQAWARFVELYTPLLTARAGGDDCQPVPRRAAPLRRYSFRSGPGDGRAHSGEVAARQPARAAWLKEVAALPPEARIRAVNANLRERNPGFEGALANTRIEGGKGVAAALDTSRVMDSSSLRAVPHLKRLSLAGNYSDLYDLAPLRSMALTHLDISNTRVALQGMALEALECAGLGELDDAPVRAAPLERLWCDFWPERDAATLRAFRSLREINRMPAHRIRKSLDACKAAAPADGKSKTGGT